MRKFILSVALAAASAFAWALPSLTEVEAQVQQGHYAQAETMMREVVAAKPDSARAHYIYAEILARDGKFAAATDEARLARQLDPDVKFTNPEKFSAFEALLQRQQGDATRGRTGPAATPGLSPAAPVAMAPTPAAASAGVPSWVWLGGLALVAFLLWRGFSRSRTTAAASATMVAPAAFGGAPAGPNAGPPGMPYGSGYPAARPGSGMLGVGMAAAGGVAAGMLADQWLNRRSDAHGVDPASGSQAGFFDSPQGGSAASDLESRPVDFGTGGADWDSGSIDVGGGSDGGGSDGGGWD
jgi:Tetratricopeptide repeat